MSQLHPSLSPIPLPAPKFAPWRAYTYRCVHGPHARDAIVGALCPRPICKSFCLASGVAGCDHERLAARTARRVERGVRHGSCRARSGLCVGLCVGVEQPASRYSLRSARPAQRERRRARAAAVHARAARQGEAALPPLHTVTCRYMPLHTVTYRCRRGCSSTSSTTTPRQTAPSGGTRSCPSSPTTRPSAPLRPSRSSTRRWRARTRHVTAM